MRRTKEHTHTPMQLIQRGSFGDNTMHSSTRPPVTKTSNRKCVHTFTPIRRCNLRLTVGSERLRMRIYSCSRAVDAPQATEVAQSRTALKGFCELLKIPRKALDFLEGSAKQPQEELEVSILRIVLCMTSVPTDNKSICTLPWITPGLLTVLLALQKLSFAALQQHVCKRQELNKPTKEFFDGVLAASSTVCFAERSAEVVMLPAYALHNLLLACTVHRSAERVVATQEFHQLCKAVLGKLHALKQQDSTLLEHMSMQEILAALKGEGTQVSIRLAASPCTTHVSD